MISGRVARDTAGISTRDRKRLNATPSPFAAFRQGTSKVTPLAESFAQKASRLVTSTRRAGLPQAGCLAARALTA